MYPIKLSVILIFLFSMAWSPFIVSSNIFKDFKISTADAVVYDHTESSLLIESKSPTYKIKMEPSLEGSVVFSIGGYGYSTTLRVPNLTFGVKIEGFKDGEPVAPSFNIDDSYGNIRIDHDVILFRKIFEPIPVHFHTSVDSIKLHFSNSHNLDVHQYLSIEDLQVVGNGKVQENPEFITDNTSYSIMFGIEGSTSVDKSERKLIARQLINYFKKETSELDSNAISFVEFGKKATEIVTSTEQKEIVKNIKTYKKAKASPKHKTTCSNWEAVLDKALEQKPDLFILITDRWSNYSNQGVASFNTQYQSLIKKCNKLKANGTRLLFITAGLQSDDETNPALYPMLNRDNTCEVSELDLYYETDLKYVDLISIEDFEAFELIDFSTLVK